MGTTTENAASAIVKDEGIVMHQEARAAGDLIVYLHGFDLSGHGYPMPKLIEYVNAQVPGANSCAVLAPLFNSRDYSFFEIASVLMQRYGQQLGQFRRRYAVCHSMGGVIARQMNLLGANFDAVVTLNSPHEGTAGWAALLTWFVCKGSQSLLPNGFSADLTNLNAQDTAFRSSYHFVGAAYHGNSPGINPLPHDNDNDTLVERASQNGDGLGGGIKRYSIMLDFGWGSAPQSLAGIGGQQCPHGTLINYPHGNNPLAAADTSPLATALQNAIRL